MKQHFNLTNLVDAITLGICYYYLSFYFPKEYLLLDTIVTGGDTASHHATVDYLKNNLLPKGKIIGWFHGNYGGFPLFIYYFPLLFVLAAYLGHLMPLTVALKIVTIIGPLLLPLCTYLMLRLCNFRFPGPALGTIASILFLVNTSNSMWGGNIYSTFAGEFSYALSFSLTFLFFGLLYRIFKNINETPDKFPVKYTISAIITISAIGLTHGFTLIICAVSSLYFLFTKKHFLKKFFHLAVIFGIGSALFAFWFVPLFFNLPYTTQYNLKWIFNSWKEVAPDILIPTAIIFIIYSLYALLPRKYKIQILSSDERAALPFIWFIILCCTGAYYLSTHNVLQLPDIRFIPFVQYLTAVWGAAFLAVVFNQKIIKLFLPLLCLKLALFLIQKNPTDAQHWAKWNYKGYENAPAWSIFKETNNYLKGTFSDPRVAFEHHDNNNTFGSTRAFENLPLFSGRATLEGLYFQSSLLSPFIFYAQSLYSKMFTCPFPDYQCSSLNLEKAYDYLKLFNVNQLIFLTKETKDQLKNLSHLYSHEKTILQSNYEIWKLNQPAEYIEVLKQNPAYVEPNNFRETFYSWFKEYNQNSKFLYTKPEKFGFFYGFDKIPKLAPEIDSFENIANCKIEQKIEDESISFKTNCPGKPHLIKFAYNPAWKVKGAIGPYLISPAFMLVYPTEENVVLTYDNSFTERVGETITVIGFILLLGLVFYRRRPKAIG